jgi:hypothetical protein
MTALLLLPTPTAQMSLSAIVTAPLRLELFDQRAGNNL